VKPEGPISRFIEMETLSFEIPETGAVDLNAVVVTVGDDGKATKIERIQKIIE
jgi:calcineurin-like phosphoesterase